MADGLKTADTSHDMTKMEAVRDVRLSTLTYLDHAVDLGAEASRVVYDVVVRMSHPRLTTTYKFPHIIAYRHGSGQHDNMTDRDQGQM